MMAIKQQLLKKAKKAQAKGDRERDQYGNPRELDLSNLEAVPDVPQFALERYDPPRGRPSNLDAILTPETARRMMGYAQQGEGVGGRAWYNAQPLRNEFVTELGPSEGPAGFNRFIDLVAATSPRSKVDGNIRRASLLYGMDRAGQPIAGLPNSVLPAGYGHLAHETHNKLLADLEGGGNFQALNRPKTSSFAENLKGNQGPMTIDTHNMSAVTGDFKTKKSPSGTQYRYIEDFEAELADKLNMTPAQFQASVWMGGGTGVADIRPFMEVFDDVLARTAERDSVSKREALTSFIRGDKPLWQLAGGATLAGGMAVAPEEAEAGPVTGILARTARDSLPNFDDQVKQYRQLKRSEPGFAKMELEFLNSKIEEMLNRGNIPGAQEMAGRIEALAETGSRVPKATRQRAARVLVRQPQAPGQSIDPVARALEDEIRLIERDIAGNPSELLADRGRLKRDQERLQGALESLRLQRGLPPAAVAGAGLLGALGTEEAQAGPVNSARKMVADLPGRNELNWWPISGDEAIEDGWNKTGDELVILDKIFLDTQNRGRGEGRKIVNQLIKDAAAEYPGREMGLLAEPLDEYTDADQLVKFYESLGFDVGDYVDGMSGIPMTMRLPALKAPEANKGKANLLGRATPGAMAATAATGGGLMGLMGALGGGQVAALDAMAQGNRDAIMGLGNYGEGLARDVAGMATDAFTGNPAVYENIRAGQTLPSGPMSAPASELMGGLVERMAPAATAAWNYDPPLGPPVKDQLAPIIDAWGELSEPVRTRLAGFAGLLSLLAPGPKAR
jgi:GNAT superfamily N-acetyltransferase